MGFFGYDHWKTKSPDDERLGPSPDDGEDEEPPAHALDLCGRCGSEGYLYSGHPNDPHPRCVGVCPSCMGTGTEWVTPSSRSSATTSTSCSPPDPQPPGAVMMTIPIEDARSEGHAAGMDEAADFCIEQVAAYLKVRNYEPGDGSEEWRGDVGKTIFNILVAAGVLDADTYEPTRPAVLASLDAATTERDALRKELAEAVTHCVNSAAVLASMYEWADRVEAAGGTGCLSGMAAAHAMMASIKKNRRRAEDLVLRPAAAFVSRQKEAGRG